MNKLNYIYNKIFKFKSFNHTQHYTTVTPHDDYPTISGYIFTHVRATDTVLIGPFATLDSAWDWYNLYGEPLSVSPNLTHLLYPSTTYNSIWGLMSQEQNL